MERTAIFDSTRRYRYRLGRSWNPGLPRLAWVMLNPNKADERRDDPTIRRCVGFAQRWGFGSIEVVNLFGLRTDKPRELLSAEDPVGRDNRTAVEEVTASSDIVVGAWGMWGRIQGRASDFRASVRKDLYCLGLTAGGEPRHPLYLARDTLPWLLQTAKVPEFGRDFRH